MRKKVFLVLFAFGLPSILGGVGYAASSHDTAPATASPTEKTGNTVTVRGTPLEGGCTYSFSAAPPGESEAIPVTIQDIPLKSGGRASSGSMSVASGSRGGSVNMISEDLPNCVAVVEVSAPGTGPVHEGGTSASSSASSSSQASGNVVTIQGSPAHTAIIAFGGLSGNDSRFNTYNESGFKVSSNSGSWETMTSYGHPKPAIVFKRSADEPTTTGEVEITHGGSAFSFQSVDLYSSITPIPYTISGYRNSELVFRVSETVPNTFGKFAKVTNAQATESIDRLTISLSNPATACCWNPVGLDNIVVSF